ncbi:indole-3-glycerol phosphate synthase TrpC [Skermanella pratensis]|uniref:indole-3-glycerol phosphate synthase TrpC n=1 Tax=Skermanella pratensis TaxID=2233999 RepID=UPI0013019047|nr:indole-3-glycerol phosphate synthase TrpC [Skermanella pratensis]
MSDVLTRICADKRAHVAARRSERSFAEMDRAALKADPPRGFTASLRRKMAAGDYGLIAEIKRASPSKGLIRQNFNPTELAVAYQAGGAACLSVLTDIPYFQGQDSFLVEARAACELPCLRKDFMLDPYQVVEARALGADCILLIMAALDDATARELAEVAARYGMDILVEVHNGEELDRALDLPCELIGINNRNLKTLAVDLAVTEELAARVPANRLLVSESGLYGPADLERMARVGARCFLVGESLMRQTDVAEATRTLLSRRAAA